MTEHAGVNCDADVQANALFVSLTADAPVPPTVDLSGPLFSFAPDFDSDLYKDVVTVTLEELTDGCVGGDGVFDTLMASVDLHINREFKNNRLTGDQYANVYLNSLTAVLDQSVKFLLTKDRSRWEALTAQMQARIAEIKATEALIELEKVKVETQKAIFDMQNSGAEYAATKMRLSNLDVEYCLTKAKVESETYNRNFLLPAKLAIDTFQRDSIMTSEVAMNEVRYNRLLPSEAALNEFNHREILPIERDTAAYNLNTVMTTQVAIEDFKLTKVMPVAFAIEQFKLNTALPAAAQLVDEQKEAMRAQTLDNRSDALTPVTGLLGRQRTLVEEQGEAERAKTLDTRSDAVTVVGSIGKQKDLYTQQIDSFIKDAQHKTAKMWLDSWITQKTLDEGLAAPDEFVNAQVDIVMGHVRANNNLS
jgi:hypothetical protein